MRRIALWFLATLSTVVLLFSYRTSTSSSMPTIAIPAMSTVAPSTSGGTTAAPSTPGGTPAVAGATVAGAAASTPRGPVQVRITVSGGRVTAVDVVQYPSGSSRGQQINAYAIPILVQETLKAQSANIDMVSGATVTSTGYVQSLQSALDRAGIA